MDGARCHISLDIVKQAEKLGVTLLLLPSNTTHELQPFDKSVFKSLETYWDEELLSYWTAFPSREMNKGRFGIVFTKAWDRALMPKNVKAGFVACGISPYNPSIIPDEAFAPSEVTEVAIQTDNDATTNSESPNTSTETPEIEAANVSSAAPAQANAAPAQSNAAPSTSNAAPNIAPTTSNTAPTKSNKKSNVSAKSKTTKTSTPEKEVPFNILVTPKIGRPKRIVKKSVNYRAVELTRNLFDTEHEHSTSEDDPSGDEFDFRETPPKGKKRKPKKYVPPVQTFKKKLAEMKKNKSSENVRKKPTGKENENLESWYCYVCDTEDKLDMRQCVKCHIYVHEECVGWSEEDLEAFVCPKCEISSFK